MSATAPVETAAETAPVEPTPIVETAPAPAAQVEAALLSKDPEVVAANLEKAEPVEAPAEPTTTEATTAEATGPAEETPAEPAPVTPGEKKEGSTLLSFLKKHVPNPKAVEKKGKAVETPAKTEEVAPPTEEAVPTIVEPVEEKPFEGGQVDFKTHGGFFGGGWKARSLVFGKEDGYKKETLYPYIGIHKASALVSGADKTQAAWSNAAQATITGVGLLIVVKSKAVDVPLNIINLADVTDVVVSGTCFTVKTVASGDYDFNAYTIGKAKVWKTEIEKRVEQSKLTHSGVLENEEYKSAYAHYQGNNAPPAKTPEAVTSDEEGALSGEETKKPGKWSRRISGSLGRLTSPTKEKDNALETREVVPVAEETAAVEVPAPSETAPVIPETVITEAPETATETTPTESKKEKRKSFTGFTTLFKNKAAKEPSPEPATAEETTETAPAETAAAESSEQAAVVEPAAAAEDPTPAPETPKEKSKRTSLFGGLLPKKEHKEKSAALTNGEPTEPAATTTEEPVPAATEVVPEEAVASAETNPETPTKKNSLGRRLTSQFKSFGRSKSPDKGKTAKVSDEAPKIDTAIESTPESAPAADTTAPTEPLATTEAPPAPVDSTPSEPPTAPVVSTKA